MYAILNKVVVYYSNWNEAVWSQPKLPKKQKKTVFHLARSLIELLLFAQSWFSLLEFTHIFQIYGNIFNFTQIWMKLSQFAQISLRLLKFTQMILILSKFE